MWRRLFGRRRRRRRPEAVTRGEKDYSQFAPRAPARSPDVHRHEGAVESHESPLRLLYADASGDQYDAYPSLEAARRDPDAALVMEGDWGGQIYVACPVSVVDADERALRQLLRDLDAVAWPVNRAAGASLYFEALPVGSEVAGGMGGGVVYESIWIHEEFEALGLSDGIREVVRGRRERLDTGPPRSWIPPS